MKETNGRFGGAARRAALVLTPIACLAAWSASPAAAASNLDDGQGGETMVGVVYQPIPNPGPPCAHYSAYNASVVFGSGTSTIVAHVTSGAAVWDEGPAGTYAFNSGCSAASPSSVSGFRYTLTGPGLSAADAVNCVAVPASYLRNGLELTVTADPGTLCSYTSLTYDIKDGLPPDPIFGSTAYCNSPIAPSACVIDRDMS